MTPDLENTLLHCFLVSLILLFILHILESLLILNAKKLKKTGYSSELTIVVAARNEKENLKRLIPALLKQSYKKKQIIICLDRCQDSSLELMKTFESSNPEIKTIIIDSVPEQFSPKKYALTLGITAASSEWVVLTDADCLPSSNVWLQSIANVLDTNVDFILGCGPYKNSPSLINHFVRYETFTTARNYLSSAILKNPYMGVGRNLAFRRALFLSNNGYRQFQHINGGDDDLFVQQNARGKRTEILIGSETLMHSQAPADLMTYWRQKVRHYSVGKFYKASWKLNHGARWILTLLLWISFVILAFNLIEPWVIFPLFLGFFIFKGIFDYLSAKRMGFSYNFYLLPALEVIHAVFVPLAVSVSGATKKIKWK